MSKTSTEERTIAGANAVGRAPSIEKETIQVVAAQPKAKLDALTSLRFFAAFSVATLHLLAKINISVDYPHSRMLTQGVSFFFVLSGFVLTYVYSGMRRPADVNAFLLARFARIWPVHVACILLGLTVMFKSYFSQIVYKSGEILIVQLSMVQSWFPSDRWNLSLNGAAWSVSDEWFFYLCFPLLIVPWRFGWWAKLVVVVIVTAAVVVFFASQDLYYASVCPLTRLLEFVTGMAVCTLWLRTRSQIRLGMLWGSIAEVSFFLFMSLYLLFEWQALYAAIPLLTGKCSLTEAMLTWFIHCGNGPLYAALIYLMALEQGFISKALKHPWLVWLGEISYSIYLVHFLLIQYMSEHAITASQGNAWLLVVTYCLTIIGVSQLMYCLIERPCRNWLKALPRAFATRKDFKCTAKELSP